MGAHVCCCLDCPRADHCIRSTADTLLAASTFLEVLSIWKKDEPEITSKTKYAKYHALRILKAIKAGEDPNLTNPVQETQQPTSPPALDPSDPEVQSITQPQQPSAGPYQPYVESVPNTVQPSPALAPDVSPPPLLPSAPTGYTHASHNDVSPISQPASPRQGSVASVGGGYFPRTDAPPTFTSENTAPGLPTAPSVDSTSMDTVMGGSSDTPVSQLPPAPIVPDASSFYQDAASSQNPFQSAAPAAPPQQFQSPFNTQPPPVFQPSPNPATFQKPSPAPPHNPYSQPTAPPPASSAQGPFRNDEDSIREAQKHAKWAISALNFDDSATAVKELRIALNALGAI
jgi:vacuolar protein sorting-associated protein VTA1